MFEGEKPQKPTGVNLDFLGLGTMGEWIGYYLRLLAHKLVSSLASKPKALLKSLRAYELKSFLANIKESLKSSRAYELTSSIFNRPLWGESFASIRGWKGMIFALLTAVFLFAAASVVAQIVNTDTVNRATETVVQTGSGNILTIVALAVFTVGIIILMAGKWLESKISWYKPEMLMTVLLVLTIITGIYVFFAGGLYGASITIPVSTFPVFTIPAIGLLLIGLGYVFFSNTDKLKASQAIAFALIPIFIFVAHSPVIHEFGHYFVDYILNGETQGAIITFDLNLSGGGFYQRNSSTHWFNKASGSLIEVIAGILCALMALKLMLNYNIKAKILSLIAGVAIWKSFYSAVDYPGNAYFNYIEPYGLEYLLQNYKEWSMIY